MKWVNHRIVGFSLPFAFTGLLSGDRIGGFYYFLFALATSAFSTLPDSIEGRRLILKHRGISHNLFAWLILFAPVGIVLLLVGKHMANLMASITVKAPFLLTLFFFVGLSILAGVFTHLIADSLTMTGIPLKPIKKRFALKLFRTGQPVEYVISLATLVAACLINYKLFMASFLYLSNSDFNINDLMVLGRHALAYIIAH